MVAKKYDELPVEKWNTRHFQDFMKDKHEEILGVTYQPGGGWAREIGLLGTLIGTQKKAAQYDKALIKEFIERCIAEYKPRQGFPGISFMFMWTFRKNTLQQLEIEHRNRTKEEAVEDVDYASLKDYL